MVECNLQSAEGAKSIINYHGRRISQAKGQGA